MNPLRLRGGEGTTNSISTGTSARGDLGVRQTTIVGHIKKLDEFVLGLLGERRAIRVACPRVQAFLGKICTFWRCEQRKTLARNRRWGRPAIFREDVLETRFQLERCVKRNIKTTWTHRPPFVISRHRRQGAGHPAGCFVCPVGMMAQVSLGGETVRVSR